MDSDVVYINGMTVGDVASNDDVNIGRNLARKASLAAHDGVITESEYHYTINGSTNKSNNTGLAIGIEGSHLFEVGKKYVISYKFSVNKPTTGTIDKVAGH
jgi:hypothetical protein